MYEVLDVSRYTYYIAFYIKTKWCQEQTKPTKYITQLTRMVHLDQLVTLNYN